MVYKMYIYLNWTDIVEMLNKKTETKSSSTKQEHSAKFYYQWFIFTSCTLIQKYNIYIVS